MNINQLYLEEIKKRKKMGEPQDIAKGGFENLETQQMYLNTGLKNVISSYAEKVKELENKQKTEQQNLFYEKKLREKYLGEQISNLGGTFSEGSFLDLQNMYLTESKKVDNSYNLQKAMLEENYKKQVNEINSQLFLSEVKKHSANYDKNYLNAVERIQQGFKDNNERNIYLNELEKTLRPQDLQKIKSNLEYQDKVVKNDMYGRYYSNEFRVVGEGYNQSSSIGRGSNFDYSYLDTKAQWDGKAHTLVDNSGRVWYGNSKKAINRDNGLFEELSKRYKEVYHTNDLLNNSTVYLNGKHYLYLDDQFLEMEATKSVLEEVKDIKEYLTDSQIESLKKYNDHYYYWLKGKDGKKNYYIKEGNKYYKVNYK